MTDRRRPDHAPTGSRAPRRQGTAPGRPAPTADQMAAAGLPRWLAPIAAAPRTVVFVGVLALLLGALFAPAPLGGLLLLVLAAALAALLARTWPVLSTTTRVLRVVVLVALTVAAVTRIG